MSAENILVGDEIVRHRLASRVIHWLVAVFFFLSLLQDYISSLLLFLSLLDHISSL